MNTIEKLIALFCLIVFITFMANHGHMDYSGIDWVKEQVTAAATSEEGQEYIKETKDISKDVFHQLFYAIKYAITGKGEPSKKEESKETVIENETVALQAAELVSCVNGNTIIVKIEDSQKTVRLIGVDAPKDNNYATISTEYIKTILRNTTDLYLEYDVSTEDNYGRTLAYVWITDKAEEPEKNLLNSILVKNGFATDAVFLPNNKYSDIFMTLRMEAKQKKNGLWKNNDFSNDTKEGKS